MPHPYQDRPFGLDEPRIKAAYDKAKKTADDGVMTDTAKGLRACAATSQIDYLAEGGRSDFGKNDNYPLRVRNSSSTIP